MKIDEWTCLFEKGRRRAVVVGHADHGVLVGLDLEGRLFAFWKGEVLHRTNPQALLGESHAGAYLNPGGDGFWPAPEGGRFGYEYPTGRWRVPPGLTGARYRVVAQEPDHVTVRAEIDLVNDQGIGLPVAFQRQVAVSVQASALRLAVIDSIEYLGRLALEAQAARLAPWTLAQFDTSPGMEVEFPAVPASCIRDFYDRSDDLRRLENDRWHVRTEGGRRFQIGLAPSVPWIELVVPRRRMRVRRTGRPVSPGEHYIDIADQPPDQPPLPFATRYSVYNDAGDFMEIEVVGPGADTLVAGRIVAHEVVTEFLFD